MPPRCHSLTPGATPVPFPFPSLPRSRSQCAQTWWTSTWRRRPSATSPPARPGGPRPASATPTNQVRSPWGHHLPFGIIVLHLGALSSFWDHRCPFGIITSLLGSLSLLWDHHPPFGVITSLLGSLSPIWGHCPLLGSPSPFWGHHPPFGVITSYLGSLSPIWGHHPHFGVITLIWGHHPPFWDHHPPFGVTAPQLGSPSPFWDFHPHFGFLTPELWGSGFGEQCPHLWGDFRDLGQELGSPQGPTPRFWDHPRVPDPDPAAGLGALSRSVGDFMGLGGKRGPGLGMEVPLNGLGRFGVPDPVCVLVPACPCAAPGCDLGWI